MVETARRAARDDAEHERVDWLVVDLAYALARPETPQARAAAEQLVRSTLAPQRPASAARAALAMLAAECAKSRGALGEALADAARAQAVVEALEQGDTRNVLLTYCTSLRAQFEIDLGLIELAFERLSSLERSLDLTSIDADPRLAHWVTFANAALAAGQHARVLSMTTEEALADAPSAVRAQLLVQRGIALTEMRRDELGSAEEAEQALRAALAIESLEPAHVDTAHATLADLSLLERRFDRAAEELAHLEGRTLPATLRARVAGLAAALAIETGAPRERLEALRERLASALDANLAAWRSVERRPGGVGLWHFGSRRAPYSEWVRVCLALDGSQVGLERALEPMLEAQSVGSLARALDTSVNMAQVREQLCRDGRGVLWIVPAMNRSHVFTLDAYGIEHHEAPAGDELLKLSDALAQSVASARESGVSPRSSAELRDGALRRSGVALAQALLNESQRAKVLRWSECVVVGAELAGDLPLPLAVLDDGLPLGLRLPLVVAPSLPIEVALARRARARALNGELELVVLADPLVSTEARERYPKARELDLSRAERARLQAGFAAEHVRWFEREQASLEALADEELATARALVVLAHGVFDSARRGDGERPSALVLSACASSADGVVWCADVERLRAPPLVELLACGAARGPLRLGDDAAGHLVGAFMLAGADCVLAARVDVERDVATRFGECFHRSLREHGRPSRALLAARRALAEHPSESDPLAWATLGLHGFGDFELLEPQGPGTAASAANPLGIAALALAVGTTLALLVALRRADRRRDTSSDQ